MYGDMPQIATGFEYCCALSEIGNFGEGSDQAELGDIVETIENGDWDGDSHLIATVTPSTQEKTFQNLLSLEFEELTRFKNPKTGRTVAMLLGKRGAVNAAVKEYRKKNAVEADLHASGY
jgi:hypothetical protein